MRLLFVTHPVVLPLKSGGQIRLWNTLQALKNIGKVDVVAFQSPQSVKGNEAFSGCHRVVGLGRQWIQPTEIQRRAYASTFGRLALLIGLARPFGFIGPPNNHLAKWFKSFVQAGRYDAIWIVRANSAIALGWKDRTRTILDGDDFEYVREAHVLRTTPWYGAKMLNYVDILKLAWWERQLPTVFARVVRCSEEDRRRLAHRRVVVVPNGATIPPFPERQPVSRLMFVGTFAYVPNRLGIEWFLRQVWPRVRRQLPDAQMDVVGASPDDWLLAQNGVDGVHVHGFVEDLRGFWRQAAGSIVPLFAASGTRLKILESLANAVPVVSTKLGAFGLHLGADDGVLRADRPEEFAARCLELLRDPQTGIRLGAHGRKAVQARYDWESVRRRVQSLVVEVANGAMHSSNRY